VAYRPVIDSIPRATARPANVEELERALEQLRAQHRGAIFERFGGAIPKVAESAFVAPGAAIVGDVTLGPESSVWFGCVLRGDVSRIEIGARSNLQDGTVVHLADRHPTLVGEDVVVGHRAVLHGCSIESGCLVGIQATLLDGSTVGRGSIIGSCALVTAGMAVPNHSLVLGVPGKVIKRIDPEEEEAHRQLAAKYTRLAHNYRQG